MLLNIGAVVTARSTSASSDVNEIPADMQPKFDDAILLESFQLDLELNEIILNWKAETSPSESFTVFAHMLDEDGNILTQADAPPRLPTKYWRWGESYTTYHRFPSEFNMINHQVIVGWYINDGLTHPKAEYVKTLTAAEIEQTQEAEVVFDAAQSLETEISDEVEIFAGEEQTEAVFDSFTIPWDKASEVIELTPTPEPTEEGADTPQVEYDGQDESASENAGEADTSP